MSTDNANSTTRPQAAACGSKQPPTQGKTYFLIAGEASGDLHAANLIAALRKCDAAGKFYAYGGDKMREAGAELLCNYRDIAYMGFVPVMLHFRVILRAMARCKRQISEISPDVVILVDYPGFNLSIAEYVKKHTRIPVFYYISPKIWAWRESRIKNIRRDVDEMFCILPFETDFYARHNYKVHYVGNPTVDEVDEFKRHRAATAAKPQQTEKTIALLAGSRKQEIKDNLQKMCIAAEPFTHKGYKIVVAAAPSLDSGEYARHIPGGMLADGSATIVSGKTYDVLAEASAALVTSGTATLETALFYVPQVVCYYTAAGRFVSFLRKHLLHVPYISLVNLIAGREVVKELVADGMTVENIRRELGYIIEDGHKRNAMLDGYRHMAKILGDPGAADNAARQMTECLKRYDSDK